MVVRRGDIYYADLSPVVGSEQGGVRPVLVVQNDVGNKHSPTIIAAAITSQKDKANLPTHIKLEQVRTIDKKRLGEKMGSIDEHDMGKVNQAIGISFGITTGGRF